MTKNPTKRQTRKRIDGATAEGEQDTQKEKKSGGKSQMGAVSRQKSSMTTEMDMTTDDETQRQKRQSSRQSKKPASRNTQKKNTKTTVPTYTPEVHTATEKFFQHINEVGVMGMCKEFDEIKTYTAPGATSDIGAKHPEKNRYADITCLDATRVILRDDVGNYTSADGDYINANWVTAEDLDRKYIACQGPKPETIEDFWRMVYQESVVSVIMMCRLEEGGKIKCADYFPTKSGDYKNYGKMFVNNKKVESEDRFDTYTLEVLPDGCSNSVIIKLLHCAMWPDQGVPSSGRMVLRMLKLAKEAGQGPTVVHCSAGVGRTGTILAIEIVTTRLLKGKEVNVPDVIKEIRNCRASCVQSDRQLLFIYTTVMDYLKAKMLAGKYAADMRRFIKDIGDMDQPGKS